MQLFGQDAISVSPTGVVSENGHADDFEIVAKGTVTNNTAGNLDLTWVRVINDVTNPSWQTLVCDNITCWGPTRDENTFALRAGESGNLDVHFQPSGEPGGGTVELYVYAVNDSANINMTVTFEADAWTVGFNDEPLTEELNVYPNPARSFLNMDFGWNSNVERLEIYSIIGQKMATYDIPFGRPDYRIDTGDLEEGMYFISMFNGSDDLLTTKAFSKVN